MHRTVRSILILTLAAPALTLAQSSQPATTERGTTERVTSGPATTEPVASSPKAALKAYNAAMRTGDLKTMLLLQTASGDEEKHFSRCSSQADLAVAALLHAGATKFGEAGAQTLARAIGDEDDAAIDAATETDSGEKATIQFRGSSTSVPMLSRKIGDNAAWSVDVGKMLRDSQADAAQLCDQLIHRGSAAKVTAQEIMAGQYTSADKAAEALKGRLKED